MQRITWNVPISEFHTQSQCIHTSSPMQFVPILFSFNSTPTSKWFAFLRRFTSLASGIKPKSRSCTMANVRAARNRIRCEVKYVSETLVQVYDEDCFGEWREGIFCLKRDDDIVDWMFYGCTALIFSEAARLLNSLPWDAEKGTKSW